MAAGVRYRYKGKFVSASKAARLGNLPSTKKFLTSEYTFKGKASTQRKGYHKAMESLVREALKKSRKEAAVKRIEREPSRRQAQAKARRAADKHSEQLHALDIAERAAKLASRDDIDIADAIDRLASRSSYEPREFDYFDSGDIVSFASYYIDYGDSFFDLADLENEDKYTA